MRKHSEEDAVRTTDNVVVICLICRLYTTEILRKSQLWHLCSAFLLLNFISFIFLLFLKLNPLDDMYNKRVICRVPVRLLVYPSRSCVVSKRINLSSKFIVLSSSNVDPVPSICLSVCPSVRPTQQSINQSINQNISIAYSTKCRKRIRGAWWRKLD